MQTIYVFCFSFSSLALANRGQARPGWPCGRGFPVFFYPLANMAKTRPQAGLTPAFRPGFEPGLPQSGRVPDARVGYKMYPKLVNVMFSSYRN